MNQFLRMWELLEKDWKVFVTTGTLGENIRPIISDSWLRCKQGGMNPYSKIRQCLPSKNIEAELHHNSALISTASPIIRNLYNLVEGSGFLISLASSGGVIIDVVGTPVIQKARLHIGDLWAEEAIGTNSIGLCILTKKPVQVFSYEHFMASACEWTCSSAPIFDEKGELIGVLTMTGEYDKVHPHTLGMVVAAVSALENNLRMKQSLDELALSSAYKTTIMESIDEGILALNLDKTIKHINKSAHNILKITIPIDQVISVPITQVLSDSHPILNQLSKFFTDTVINEGTVFIDEGSLTVTSKLIRSADSAVAGVVLVLREMRLVKKFVNRIVGSRANFTFGDLIGKDPVFLSAVNLAQVASRSDSNVLLLGESGTGKELFAQAIHNSSKRSRGPFIAINCAALPRSLIESELFGYAEGAFTGAKKGGNPGKFELADGGTLFLDEIGEMSLELQATLLRVLQEGTITRIGGKEVIPVNVRVIAATNKELLKEIRNANFREDLYYRLNVLAVHIPPLRNRKSDISLLANSFVGKLNQRVNKHIQNISEEVLNILELYNWPGNVRELQNVMERALNVCSGDTIVVSNLPEPLCNNKLKVQPKLSMVSMKEYEKDLIIRLLKEFNGNRTQIAQAMGISRTSLYRKLEFYNIKD